MEASPIRCFSPKSLKGKQIHRQTEVIAVESCNSREGPRKVLLSSGTALIPRPVNYSFHSTNFLGIFASKSSFSASLLLFRKSPNYLLLENRNIITNMLTLCFNFLVSKMGSLLIHINILVFKIC